MLSPPVPLCPRCHLSLLSSSRVPVFKITNYASASGFCLSVALPLCIATSLSLCPFTLCLFVSASLMSLCSVHISVSVSVRPLPLWLAVSGYVPLSVCSCLFVSLPLCSRPPLLWLALSQLVSLDLCAVPLCLRLSAFMSLCLSVSVSIVVFLLGVLSLCFSLSPCL